MRILVSVDMEGLPDVFYTDTSAGRTGGFYSESREVMTRLSSALAEGFHSAGVADIIVEDSHGKMVILVAGDDKLENDVKSRTPWAEYVVLKNSAGYWSSSYDSLPVVEARLRDSAKKSISRMVPWHAAKSTVLRQSGPFEFIFEMKRSVYADVCELVPGIVRLDGYRLSYMSKTATEGFRVMQLLSYASIGTETSMSD